MCLPTGLLSQPDICVEPTSDTGLSQYYLNTIKPQILTAFRKDPSLKWVSFTLLETSATPVLHIGAVNSTDPRWGAFRSAIEPVVEKSPKKVTLEIIDEVLKDLAGIVQPCPFRPFILGNSIAVADNVLPGTLGGYVTVVTSNGPVRLPFPRSSHLQIH